MRELTKKQELLFKKACFIASPRSYNYITQPINNSIIIIELPKFTVHQEALLDFCFHLLRKQISSSEKELPIITSKEIIRIQEYPENFPKDLGSIEFKTKDFRKTTGLQKRTDKQIIKDIQYLRKSSIILKIAKVFWEEKENRYEAIDWDCSIFSDRIIRETGKLAPRTKDPQYHILVFWGLLTGLIFYNNIRNNKVCLFPKEFYRMSRGAQKTLRYLSLWNHKKLTLEEVMGLLGWEITKNPGKRAKQVEVYFNELKRIGFITNWIRVEGTKGLKITWEFCGIRTTRELDIGRKELLLDKKEGKN